ncbi:hypothetical protein SADUNF_Sadunf10G0050100 [Salix dunnii]|uniref:Acid phosphatase/vanadium-dependent haloperoxidase-related protein n=1 Tax=Salix dunnii TaxID=1413687 RepID=A0A835MP26_9ROSI|nr:hypothetical protein SADUNF_Sadunf10G0050100 [Salix dunnii]
MWFGTMLEGTGGYKMLRYLQLSRVVCLVKLSFCSITRYVCLVVPLQIDSGLVGSMDYEKAFILKPVYVSTLDFRNQIAMTTKLTVGTCQREKDFREAGQRLEFHWRLLSVTALSFSLGALSANYTSDRIYAIHEVELPESDKECEYTASQQNLSSSSSVYARGRCEGIQVKLKWKLTFNDNNQESYVSFNGVECQDGYWMGIEMATGSSTTTIQNSGASLSSSILTNYPLISAFLAFAIAQSIKFFTSWYERRWDLKQLVGSGGMPSSHSATVAALAMAIGFQEGFGGSLFSIALILACVMYDATGVRLQAGRQAEVLNQILYELPAEHPLSESTPLRELLGHTPPQVIAGGLLGLVTAVIGHLITILATSRS